MSSDDHKAALFDTLVNAVGDDFYFIHPEDGSIQVLKSQNAASFSLQQEGEGDYDYYMEQTILKRSTDSTPSDVIEKMRLKSAGTTEYLPGLLLRFRRFRQGSFHAGYFYPAQQR